MNNKMTDSQFYQRHKNYGKNALEWRRKFIGMLPEAYERRIHEKKGYGSIFEYAAKICGLSEKHVREVLNLEKKFKKTPKLHNLLVSGEVSSNKLARVASIATPQNEVELVEQVKRLSRRAMDVYVKDKKMENGLDKPQNEAKSLSGQKSGLSFELSEEVLEKLQGLRQKGHDVNEILLELLEKREEEIQIEKDEIAQNLPAESSRNVPVRIVKVLKKEFGCKCAVPGCNRRSEILHHTGRFALTKQHNPHFIAPLCKAHHEIAHSIDLKVRQNRNRSI